LQYRDSYMQVRDAMNGMLSINFKYHMPASYFQQFARDVIKAFNHPLFSGLQRVREPAEVVVFHQPLTYNSTITS